MLLAHSVTALMLSSWDKTNGLGAPVFHQNRLSRATMLRMHPVGWLQLFVLPSCELPHGLTTLRGRAPYAPWHAMIPLSLIYMNVFL